MTRLHFHPIRGKAVDIIDAILHTKEVESLAAGYDSIHLAVVELVSNIADYAYPEGNDDYLDVELQRDEKHITIRFIDGGVPFNPLEKDPPDISLPMAERKIGGLGIFLVIKKMESVTYEYTDGENILTISL